MAQSKMTTDMAYSKVEETVRGQTSEKMMLRSQVKKLKRDLMARDKEAQENSNLVVQLQPEKEQIIQANQEADRETERLAKTVQLNIQKQKVMMEIEKAVNLLEALEKSEKMKDSLRMEVEKLQQQLSQQQLENSSLMKRIKKVEEKIEEEKMAAARRFWGKKY